VNLSDFYPSELRWSGFAIQTLLSGDLKSPTREKQIKSSIAIGTAPAGFHPFSRDRILQAQIFK
jgi:hypothetical protein